MNLRGLWGRMASCGPMASALSQRLLGAKRPIDNRPQVSNLPHRISVLAITSNDGDRRLLSSFSIRGQWDLVFTSTCQEALAILKSGRAAVIICDRDLPGPDWRECVRSLAAARPECPILLMSSIYDEYLWEEVVHIGGYDVAPKPLQEEQVVGAVNLAWSYAKNL